MVNWASDARQHAITQAQRRKKGEVNPLLPLGGTPEYTGYARDPRDRSRTHFKDLSSSHPNNPTFSKLASQEDAYWKSGAWIPDAGLKTDTSIEETIGLVTGIPSLARLGATGVRAAVGSGRQALANRGVGGWTKVMDPGRREFMKVGAGLAAATVVPPKILMDVLGGAAKKAAPAAAAAVTPYADSAAMALYKKIAREPFRWEAATFNYNSRGMPGAWSSNPHRSRELSQYYRDQYYHWKGRDKQLRNFKEDIYEEAMDEEFMMEMELNGKLDDYVGHPSPGNHIGDVMDTAEKHVHDNIMTARKLRYNFLEQFKSDMAQAQKRKKLGKAITNNQSGKSGNYGGTGHPTGTTMSRPRHGGGTVPIKVKPGGPSPSSPRPGRRNRTRTQKAIESYQESLRNRNRR